MGMLAFDMVIDVLDEQAVAADVARQRRRSWRSCIGGGRLITARLAKRRALAEMRRFGEGDHDLGGEA